MQVFGRPQPKRPSVGQRLSEGIGRGLEMGSQLMQQHEQKKAQQMQMQQENEAVKKLIGVDLSGITSPKIREKYIEMTQAQQGKQNEINQTREDKQSQEFNRSVDIDQKFKNDMELLKKKYELQKDLDIGRLQGKQTEPEKDETLEKLAPFEAGLSTINQMRQIGKKGNLGRGSHVKGFFGGETAKDIGKYEQLGKSLISLASNIPIRNQQEFATLAENLFDSSLPDSQREGILDAMESIIKGNMKQYQEGKVQSFPDATSNKGKIIRNKNTGERLKSNGKEWVPL